MTDQPDAKPFPEVGDLVRLDRGDNPNSWVFAAEVMAVFPGEAIVFRRWLSRPRYHKWYVEDVYWWREMSRHCIVKRKR